MWRVLIAVLAIGLVMPGTAAAAPTASFAFSPAAPLTGEVVTFTSTSTGTLSSQAWDLDGDRACDDAAGESAQRSFPAAATYFVTLCVSDGAGGSGSQTQPVVVGNRAPVAAFNYAPGTPLPGDSIVLTSFSADPDGPIVSQLWDLDNDGSFDDGQGAGVSVSFPAAGDYLVRLLVSDRDGAVTMAERTITVHAQVAQFMRPFPVVRVIGAVGRLGTRIREIVVTVPTGARVKIACRGGGCPKTGARRGGVAAAATLHVRRFARRLLRPGAVVQISVTKPGAIGKYMRLRILRGRSPSRVDRCLPPGAARPVRCPG
jgi:PKD repeat protein